MAALTQAVFSIFTSAGGAVDEPQRAKEVATLTSVALAAASIFFLPNHPRTAGFVLAGSIRSFVWTKSVNPIRASQVITECFNEFLMGGVTGVIAAGAGYLVEPFLKRLNHSLLERIIFQSVLNIGGVIIEKKQNTQSKDILGATLGGSLGVLAGTAIHRLVDSTASYLIQIPLAGLVSAIYAVVNRAFKNLADGKSLQEGLQDAATIAFGVGAGVKAAHRTAETSLANAIEKIALEFIDRTKPERYHQLVSEFEKLLRPTFFAPPTAS